MQLSVMREYEKTLTDNFTRDCYHKM